MQQTVFVNGVPDGAITVADRGFAYGDGVFETFRVSGGKPVWAEWHWERMAAGCERLGLPWQRAAAEHSLAQLLASATDHGCSQGVAKLVYTRGSAGRGYRPPPHAVPTIVASWHSLPEVDAAVTDSGIRVRLLTARLTINPLLAGIKHLNRLEQVLAARELAADELEGLVAARDGRLVEGVSSNVFLFLDGRWRTPRLDDFGIRGVARRYLLEHADRLGATVEEVDVSLDQLDRCEQAFLVNSVQGVWPIARMCGRQLAVGAETRRAQAMVAEELRANG